ncbi:thiamine-repressible mitochondrial transport protein THI74-like [Asparagus officinalis]|uniref:thiamine-repressible mitochondrial transport protein THI74-like n=1 Tax=Asparagus officinalis TaxID=4686 RepID=UPI00098E4B30|nr:thiamine-repressible mitochondrial transport protein THI74-like [Asparagus officinalis]
MKWVPKGIGRDTWDWALGLIYIIAVASIWIAASYLVQSVVDAGVSPFLLSYICNSLFLVYIPIVEVGRCCEGLLGRIGCWHTNWNNIKEQQSKKPETVSLLQDNVDQDNLISHYGDGNTSIISSSDQDEERPSPILGDALVQQGRQSDPPGRWTRFQVAKVSLLICPFWFFAQLTFNLSLKYTTVTSNTILSSTSSLFTFLVSLAFLGERFTWIKLISVLLCMGGTIIVGLADSESGANAIVGNPVLGDILALVSACLYAVYITLIRKKLPDEKKGEGKASMAEFLGYLGMFNLLIFLPVALVLNFTKMEPFGKLTWYQFGLIVAKGLLDNVLSDYLWAKAILLTTTTVATAGLTIQVPIAAVVDSLTGHAPHLLDCIGAAAVMAGFVGINIPSEALAKSEVDMQEQEVDGPINIS